VTEQDDTYDYWAEDPISTDEFGRVYARKIHRPDPTVWTSNDHAAFNPDEERPVDNGV
jgi:hypothetical protein